MWVLKLRDRGRATVMLRQRDWGNARVDENLRLRTPTKGQLYLYKPEKYKAKKHKEPKNKKPINTKPKNAKPKNRKPKKHKAKKHRDRYINTCVYKEQPRNASNRQKRNDLRTLVYVAMRARQYARCSEHVWGPRNSRISL